VTDWYDWVAWAVLWNWAGMLFISWLYVGTLLLTRDLKLVGWLYLWGWLPVVRFLLVADSSWYANLWRNLYGASLALTIIHRDELGPKDDDHVDQTIVHEIRHTHQQLWLGMLQWVAYGLHFAWLGLFTSANPYWSNWFEVDARWYAWRWNVTGRPKLFNLGPRR